MLFFAQVVYLFVKIGLIDAYSINDSKVIIEYFFLLILMSLLLDFLETLLSKKYTGKVSKEIGHRLVKRRFLFLTISKRYFFFVGKMHGSRDTILSVYDDSARMYREGDSFLYFFKKYTSLRARKVHVWDRKKNRKLIIVYSVMFAIPILIKFLF